MCGIELKGRSIVIGAMTRHVDVANSPVRQQALPGARRSCQARSAIRRLRHRGTHWRVDCEQRSECRLSGGMRSALGATIITNKRRIAADDFFKGMFEPHSRPDEIITKVSFPVAKKAAYEKFKHPASGFALVGVFVSKRGSDIRVAVTGAGANGVFRVKSLRRGAEEALSPRSRSRG